MNIIPVIIMKDNSRARLRFVDISNIHIRSVDTPSFVEVHNSKSDLVLAFPGASESHTEFCCHGLTISIGETSGRIYRISGMSTTLNDLTVESIANDIGFGKNVRYKTNIRYSLKLINTLYDKI